MKHKTKQNKTKQNKTKQNKTELNKTKQNKTKQNKIKQNKTLLGIDFCETCLLLINTNIAIYPPTTKAIYPI